MNRGTVACWLGVGLCVVGTGGDQGGLPLAGLFLPGVGLIVVGVARWKPWRGQGWA